MRKYVMAICIALAGCGSSDAPGPPDPLLAPFSGPYHFGAVGVAFDAGAANPLAAWGVASPNGAGLVPLTLTENTAGSIVGPMPDPGFSYTLTAAGALSFLDAGTLALFGALSADSNKAVMSQVLAGEKPLIGVFLRRSGAHSNASLTGDYHVGQFWSVYNETSPMPSAFTGTATFDGAGMGSATGTRNTSGAITNPLMFLTYAVSADGSATMTFDQTYAGGLLDGGSLGVFAGSTADFNHQRLSVFVKETAGATNALFTGTYTVVLIEGDSGLHRSQTSTLTADGAGNITVAIGTENSEGVIAASSAGTATYTVMANGSVDVTTGGSGDMLTGGISADGTFGFLAGATNAASPPILLVFVK